MSLLCDGLVHVFRFYRGSPSVVVPAILVLALGFGATLAIFAVAYAVLLRPLHVTDQQSLVIMWERADARNVSVWEVSYPNFRNWQSQNTSFTGLAATGSINWSLRLMQEDGPAVLPFAAVSGSFFEVLGVSAALGRAFTSADDTRAGPNLAVISDATWRKHFAADPHVVGRTAMLDDGAGLSAFTIAGVMPPEFDYPRGAAVWAPLARTLGRLSGREGYDMVEARDLGILYVLGRLKPSTRVSQARADMALIVDRLTGTGAPGSGRSIVLTPLADHIFGQTRPALLLLMAAAALVLVLACANVTGLMLARLTTRRRELAIHIALGADRSHVMRRSLAEGAALVIGGMAAASVIALWCVPALTAIAPDWVPRLDDVTLGSPVVATFGVAAGVLATLACGGIPVFAVARRSGVSLLGRGEVTHRTASFGAGNTLIVVQTALAVVLLVAATLTVRSFNAIQRSQLGFEPADLVTFDVMPPADTYEKHGENRIFYRDVLERVRQLSGVSAVAGIYLRPFEFGPIGSGIAVILEGQSPREREAWGANPSLNAEAVTPDYFRVMQIPVLRGRAFTEHDTENALPVVVVSASAANALWPGQDPIGKRLMASYDRPEGDWQAVVGVVGDVRYRGLTEPALNLYKPYLQSEDAVKHFIVQPSGESRAFVGLLRSEIRSVHPGAIVDAIRPMREVVDRHFAPWRFAAWLFSLLGAVAVTVAVIGLYALLAHQVAHRTREIGLRIALGARNRHIVGFFALLTLRLVVGGLVTGVVTALIAGRSMTALLFGVTPTDPLNYAIVSVVLLAAACAGGWLPIRRAILADPMLVLRRE